MSAPLEDVVPILLDLHANSSSAVNKIPLGDVAVAMLDCIQALHERGLVFVDVKSENFMLAVAERIRLIDFGLVESINDMTAAGHREDIEGSPLAGTPVYASLNVMSGHTASRRDDLEALGYVILSETLLPWSGAASDDELLKIKKREMDKTKRSESKMFSALKASGSDVVMSNYFNSVQNLKYAATPDYDSLRCYLKKLIVTVQVNGTASDAIPVSKSKSPMRKSPLRFAKREAKATDSCDDVVVIEINEDRKPSSKSPKKPKFAVEELGDSRCSTRNKLITSRTIATQTDPPNATNAEKSGHDANVTNMDWERIPADENLPPTLALAGCGKAALELEIVEGPHRGTLVPIGGHHADTIIVGKNPKQNSKSSVKNAVGVALPGDSSASSLHAKLTLTSKKTVFSIKVTDMSSTNGTFVNGTLLNKGKSRQVFPGDKIKVGDSVLEIKRC
ncbi:hypothetical protein ACHAWX_001552 [Stephanocyclus meneghinianus]